MPFFYKCFLAVFVFFFLVLLCQLYGYLFFAYVCQLYFATPIPSLHFFLIHDIVFFFELALIGR